ncbi:MULTISPECIES: hypothetical protein [unclassified Pseudomonas]|uniref:hypothetical protein n=1 Tax=unclassified Pseudomonas TaxID=196821 RepID=UPI00382B5E9E
MKPFPHAPRQKPLAAARNATKLPAAGIHHEYQAIRAAANILRDCRIETECFLSCKRATVAISVAGSMTKRALVSAAGLGGAAAGSIVPVVGTLSGGYLAATAADTFLPGYTVMPDTDPGKKIEGLSRGMFGKMASATYYFNEARDVLIDDVGNRLINQGLAAVGTAAPPVSAPIVWAFNHGKDLLKVKNTSKPDVVRQLQVGLWRAEHVIETLDARIRTAFRTRGRLRQYHDLLCMPSGPREIGVEVLNHPTNPAHWIRQSRYEKHHANAKAELEKLKRFIGEASMAVHSPAKGAAA